MNLGFSGRVAVVTGASRGIGAATADLLEEEGARVVRVSRATGIDVTRPGAADQVQDAAGDAVDILVNNAGTSSDTPLDALTDDEWSAQWELNVMAPMRLMRALAPGMADRGWGRIVNVTSSSGKRPSLRNAAYSVTKAAQLSLSRTYADAYADRGVLVNAVAPGVVATGLWLDEGGLADQAARASGTTREEVIAAAARKIPRGELGRPEEVAAVVAFLCSELAANVTGAAWSVDGGTFPAII